MRTFVLSAVGVDRPGIIAGIAEVLLRHGVNVTDSQMGILRGHFAMTLVVTAPPETDAEALAADVAAAGEALALEAVGLRPVEDTHTSSVPDWVVSLYGADHPGILAAATAALAGIGANVCDLRTRLLGEDTGSPMYVLIMEVAASDEARLREVLDAVAAEQGVEVSVNALEPDVL